MRSVIASKNIQTKKECDLSHSFLVCAPIPLAQVNNRIGTVKNYAQINLQALTE